MNHEAVYALYPNVKKIIQDIPYDANDAIVKIDLEKVNSWIDPNLYKKQRKREYPSFENQFDILYHGGYDAWKEEIDKVKKKYPKPE
jgi:hypothetical protein